MKKNHLFATVLVILTLTGCAVQQKVTKPFFFFQMADTQFGFFTGNKDFRKETINFERAIAAANRMHPLFVIVCGDLVNKPGNAAQIAEYKRIAAKLDPSIKLYNVSGNHDVENKPTPASLNIYKKEFGPDQYTFKEGNIFGIVLNSSLMKDASGAPELANAQDKWLLRALEKAKLSKAENIMIFQHHPLFITDPNEPEQYFNIEPKKRKMYLDLYKKHNVKHIFVGHYHRNGFGQSGDIQMVTTGPVGKPLGRDSSGFRIVSVNRTDVKSTYYPLDSLPSKVSLK